MIKRDEKILVISDIHLTVNFIPRKYNYLKNLFSSVDKIIINGDLWTAYYNTFDEFLKTKWNRLFPLLKNKNTVYIYGNHDRKEWQDERNNLFSTLQTDEYKFIANGVRYLVTHGHNYLVDSISNDTFMKVWRTLKIDAIKYFIEALLLRIFGRSLYFSASTMNNKVKLISKGMKDIDYVVIGHTHWAEIDKENKFINSGIIHSGVSSYIVIEKGKPTMVCTKY